MEKIFVSPARYIQGRNVLQTGLQHITKLGQRPLLLCDEIVWQIAGERLHADLKAAACQPRHVLFKGETSYSEIDRLTNIGKDYACDLVIGIGGGKVIDAAKAINDRLDSRVAIIPTAASTDAPTSAISVIYSETGVFQKYIYYKKNPDLVLVDTQVISQAPVRLLISGIADALATWIEGRAVLQKHGTTLAGGTPTLAASAIAEKCQTTLFEYGLQAVAANRAKVVTPALEAVIEANTLLSGIGFESCGLAAAHAIQNSFSVLQGKIHELTHGEKVAYATLTQLVLENRPKSELDQFINFYRKLGLPTTLKDLHLANSPYADLLKVGEQATMTNETMQQMPFSVTAADIADAMLALDSYVCTVHA